MGVSPVPYQINPNKGGVFVTGWLNWLNELRVNVNTALAGATVPTGLIAPYGGTTAPSGYLLCDGTAVSRTTYSGLYAVVGDAFGEGDGSTTFNVPDLEGRFLRGVDNSAGRDPDAGSRTAMNTGGNTGDAVGSIQGDATGLPTTDFTTDNPGNHAHAMAKRSGTVGTETGNGFTYGGSLSAQSGGTGGSHTHSVTGGGDNETRPINAGVNYIIKV